MEEVKMKKRLLSVVLAAAMAASLAGCVQKPGASGNTDSNSAGTPAESGAEAGRSQEGNELALITDVGSTKQGIHQEIIRQELTHCFVGGHPMAGSEKTGFDHSNERILENAYYILTPTRTVSPKKVEEFEKFVASIGAVPLILDYKKHDFSVGSISHLPTVIASTLVNLVKNLDDSDETLRTIAAGGFKDITRVASSDPTMWENICVANRKLCSRHEIPLRKAIRRRSKNFSVLPRNTAIPSISPTAVRSARFTSCSVT